MEIIFRVDRCVQNTHSNRFSHTLHAKLSAFVAGLWIKHQLLWNYLKPHWCKAEHRCCVCVWLTYVCERIGWYDRPMNARRKNVKKKQETLTPLGLFLEHTYSNSYYYWARSEERGICLVIDCDWSHLASRGWLSILAASRWMKWEFPHRNTRIFEWKHTRYGRFSPHAPRKVRKEASRCCPLGGSDAALIFNPLE